MCKKIKGKERKEKEEAGKRRQTQRDLPQTISIKHTVHNYYTLKCLLLSNFSKHAVLF